jgi:hypothetical protein
MRRGNPGPPSAKAVTPEEAPDDEGSFDEPRTRVASYPGDLASMLGSEREAVEEFAPNNAPTRESQNMVAALAAHDAFLAKRKLPESAPPVPPPLTPVSVVPIQRSPLRPVAPPAPVVQPEVTFGDEMPHLRRAPASRSRLALILVLGLVLGSALAASSGAVRQRVGELLHRPSAVTQPAP